MPKKESKDRRVRRTRLSLQNALLGLLEKKPLAKIQIKEIADDANVSRQVFYLHFDSKEELLFSYIDDLFAQIHRDIFADIANVKSLQREMPLILAFQQWANHEKAMQWIMQVENKDMLITRLRGHIALVMDELAEHPETDAQKSPLHEHVIDFVAGGAYMLLREWLAGGLKRTPEEMGKLTYRLLKTLPSEIG